MPAGTAGSLHFEDCIHDFQTLNNQRVVSGKDSVANELQKARIHDAARWIRLGSVWGLAGQVQFGVVDRAGAGDLSGRSWIEAHKVTRGSCDQRSLGRYGPLLEMGSKEVRIAFKESRRVIILLGARERSCTDESGDDHRQSRRGVSAAFFPPFFSCYRAAMQQKGDSPVYHHARVEIAQKLTLVKAPGEQHWERNFIQLHPLPESVAIDPEVLWKPTVLFLPGGQVYQSAQRGVCIAGSKQAHGALHHVACPNQVVPALPLFVVARLAPGNRERRDKRTLVQLVFVR
jgi:hypothetical protein